MAVIRKRDRLRLPDRPDETPPSYFFESLDFPVTDRKMEAYLAEFPLRSKPSAPHRHEGAELIFVIKGQLAVNIDGEDVSLNECDAIYFDFKRVARLSPRGAFIMLRGRCGGAKVSARLLVALL